jgi:hypothetical protein
MNALSNGKPLYSVMEMGLIIGDGGMLGIGIARNCDPGIMVSHDGGGTPASGRNGASELNGISGIAVEL